MPGERTEQATQHRREKARKEGDMLHSRELSAAAGTLAGVMVLGALGSRSADRLARRPLPPFSILGLPARWEPAEIEPTLLCPAPADARRFSGLPAVVMAAVAAAALGVGILQTGGVNFHAGAVGFKLDRINPVSKHQEPVFAARRGAAGQVADSRRPAGGLLPCSASRGS